MDAKWKDWYETTLLPLLKHSRDDKPSAELERLLARDPTGIDLALLAADADHIQRYVFESTKLPEIRGGSELLQTLNEELRDLITMMGLPKGCVLFAGGGSFLALVPNSIVDELVAQIEKLYPERTGVATITGVSRKVSPAEILHGYGGEALSLEGLNALRSQMVLGEWQRVARFYGAKDGNPISSETFEQIKGFGQMVQVMGNLLRQRKDRPAAVPVVGALPFVMRCRICQIRPAESMHLYFDEPWPLCDTCRRKARTQWDRDNRETGWAREVRSRQVETFLDWLNDNDPKLETHYLAGVACDQTHYSQDLNELGAACQARSGYVGFIYADGNRVGRAFESLPTPSAYSEFSSALERSIKEAAYEALAENLYPTLVERVSPTGKPLGRGYIHPLEPLVIGGDDLMLIVPADAALPVTVRVCQLFNAKMLEYVSASIWHRLSKDLRYPTLSAGVVIAESHNPVRVLQQVAKELCKSAKRRAYDEAQKETPIYTSTLDFLLIKSQSMLRRTVKQLRQAPPYYYEENGRRTGRYLTGAPYTLDECRCLLGLLKLMRQVNFSTSQLQSLVAALQRGRQYGSVHYLYQQVRLKARLGEAQQDKNVLARLPQIWPYDEKREPIPWHRVPGEEEVFASIVPDLLELYPFVPRPAPDDLWREILMEADHDDQN